MKTMEPQYATRSPERAEIDTLTGAAILEFGTGWCGYCRAAAPLVAGALAGHEAVRHIKVEDGSGRALGRSYGVKLWPTLVFLKDGVEFVRLVRPRSIDEVRDALGKIDPSASVNKS